MYQKQAFQGEYKGGCGAMGRGKWGNQHWGRGKFGHFRERWASRFAQPPVNIEETDTSFIISLFAAGLVKEQVTLTVKDDVLTIAYPGASAGTEKEIDPDAAPKSKYTYQEYHQGGFEREFRLNNKVLTDSISAAYADGVLTVTLPKNPATNIPAQTISVA